ncbi:MAG: response regulator transcription factor [Verrucomicrobiota bacterium]
MVDAPPPARASGHDCKRIRVALVEDNAGLRESLAVLLNGTPGFVCAGSIASAEAALARVPELSPDVVLMDIHLPKISGIDCVRSLREKLPQTKILMLTVFADGEHIFQALMSGANGYLSKRTPPAELLKAVEEVHRGGAPMSPDVAVRVVAYFNQKGASIEPRVHLSPREREILAQLAQGALYKEIADKLGLAFDTVQWHIRNIYDKLHVRSRTEAVAKFLRSEPLA